MNLNGFDAAQIETKSKFELLQKGQYRACIIDSKMRPTKNDGEQLVLRFQVLNGPAKGRILFANLMLKHASSQCVEIAKRDLAKICKAINVLRPSDSSELHNKELTICVSVKKNGLTLEDENIIVDFQSSSGVMAEADVVREPIETPKTPW